jgi:hypothetical protein
MAYTKESIAWAVDTGSVAYLIPRRVRDDR